MKKKIFGIILAAALVCVTVFAATGCEQDIGIAESRKVLADAVKKSNEAKQYYVTHKITSSSGVTTFELRYDGAEEVKAYYLKREESGIAELKDTIAYFGKSLKDKVEEKDATEADYKVAGAFQPYGAKEYEFKEISADEFFAYETEDYQIKQHTISSITDYVAGLGDEELVISSVKKKGWVYYYTIDKVAKEGNPLDGCKDISINVTNEKISRIKYTDKYGKNITIDVAYGVPKISMPSWKEV